MPDIAPCPQCGKTGFQTERGRTHHVTVVHGRQPRRAPTGGSPSDAAANVSAVLKEIARQVEQYTEVASAAVDGLGVLTEKLLKLRRSYIEKSAEILRLRKALDEITVAKVAGGDTG